MIPGFQTLMLPVLKLSVHGPVELHRAVDDLADEFKLTQDEKNELVPSGIQPRFFNHVNWAKTYLKQAGLLEYPKRGYFDITEEGRKVLASPPSSINIKFLQNYEAFREFQSRKGGKSSPDQSLNQDISSSTPEEQLQSAYDTINNALASELLDQVMKASPKFFEHLILQLLQAMGYGGTIGSGSFQHTGGSGDNGVDGVISQDQLGIDQIYIQAKRYSDRKVSPSEIQQFVGALENRNALKGIFLTTSDFSEQAKKNAQGTSKRIIILNGIEIASLMVEFGVGCQEKKTIRIKKIDKDFFDENDGRIQ